jgi:Zn-dependent peptidase ImmA (M78 family)
MITTNIKVLNASGLIKQRNIHAIVSEVLLPSSVSDSLKKVLVTKELVGQLKNDFKISPTAILTILRIRKIISNEQYDQLKPPEFTPTASIPRQHQRSPNIETSVKKFCGKSATGFVNNAIKTGIIKPIPAQYILFGRVNKKKYKEYVVQAKI